MSDVTETIAREVRGVNMRLTGGNRSLELCARMNYETEVLDVIDAQSEGDVFYDLGACEGRFSVYAALKGLRVYAFEPDIDNFDTLVNNAALNDLSDEQLKPFRLALGEENRTGVLKIGQPWAGGHQKVVANAYERRDLGFDFKTSATTDIVALDSFIAAAGLEPPACLKVDIDGSERAFVAGASSTLASPALRTVIVELESDDPNFEWITERLELAGLTETSKHAIPNEAHLFNIVFEKHT